MWPGVSEFKICWKVEVLALRVWLTQDTRLIQLPCFPYFSNTFKTHWSTWQASEVSEYEVPQTRGREEGLHFSKSINSVVIIVCPTSWVNEGSVSSAITAWMVLAWRGAIKKLYCNGSTPHYGVEKWREAGHQTAGKKTSLVSAYEEKLVLHWESYWGKSLGFVVQDY